MAGEFDAIEFNDKDFYCHGHADILDDDLDRKTRIVVPAEIEENPYKFTKQEDGVLDK